MKEETIKVVAQALAKWNPLGDHADLIPDLEGYRTEAIDIISLISFSSGKVSTAQAISQVLSEAFELPLDDAAVQGGSSEIDEILGMKR